MKITILATGALFLSLSVAFGAESKPKYGPEATPLSKSHEYFKKGSAPDYWAMSPYYVPQRDGKSCSLGSVTIVMNAARVSKKLNANDELITQDKLLDKVGNEFWKSALGTLGRGVPLPKLGPIVEDSLKANGFTKFTVETVHVDDASPATLAKVRKALTENESSTKDFIIANFNQGAYTGDTGGGHISPIGAYDEVKKRVLIMDTDREWYEPYWVSDETFVKGMATKDSDSGKNRGYVWIKIQE